MNIIANIIGNIASAVAALFENAYTDEDWNIYTDENNTPYTF